MRRRRYPSDTTDAEWALLEPLLPVPACETATGGRPEKHHRREIVDAIRYVVDTGCKWRALPADYPPFLWNQIRQAQQVSERGQQGCRRAAETGTPSRATEVCLVPDAR